MSKSLSAAALNVGRLARSTHNPDGYARGRIYTNGTEIDDTAGNVILFTPAPAVEVDDKWSRLATAIESVESHPLVTRFQFSPDSLITDVGGDHPVAMGFEVLAMTLAACQAADELATLAGVREVCRVLGWKGEPPERFRSFGADRLFRNAGALQARVHEIKAERARPAVKPPAKTRGIQPRVRVASPPAAKPHAARPAPMSSANELKQRIETGREAAIRLRSPGAADLFCRALAARTQVHAEELVEQAERMLCACEATPIPSRRAQAIPALPRPACFGSSGKGASAAQLAKRAAKSERDRQIRLQMQKGGKK